MCTRKGLPSRTSGSQTQNVAIPVQNRKMHLLKLHYVCEAPGGLIKIWIWIEKVGSGA